MFNLISYKRLFESANFHVKNNSNGQVVLDALLVEPNIDGSDYTNVGYCHKPCPPLIRYMNISGAANDG